MKTSRFWGYFAKVWLGAGVAVVLAGAPIVAHAEENEPLPAIEVGSEATQNAAMKAGNSADQAGSASTGAADKATGMPDDSSITDAVKGKLEKAGTDASDIKVDSDNGVVTLSGTVHQESTRTNAAEMAKKAKGVRSVKDQIEVVPAK